MLRNRCCLLWRTVTKLKVGISIPTELWVPYLVEDLVICRSHGSSSSCLCRMCYLLGGDELIFLI
ncbi:hypothetical protein [Rubritalea tangerina]|uniref:hypothetical protein n=1 Tax=Rubritalea tangerina TaxID=430798 RepID=UPI003611EC22